MLPSIPYIMYYPWTHPVAMLFLYLGVLGSVWLAVYRSILCINVYGGLKPMVCCSLLLECLYVKGFLAVQSLSFPKCFQ